MVAKTEIPGGHIIRFSLWSTYHNSHQAERKIRGATFRGNESVSQVGFNHITLIT